MPIADTAASYPLLLPLAALILGLILGSFFNVIIYRLPLMMEAAWKRECELIMQETEAPEATETPFNLAFPHSHCPHCQAPIKVWQNIPVISYLLLGGKCSQCRTRISPRYPLIELFSGLCAFAIIAAFGLNGQSVALLVFCWALLIATCIDIDHQLLPDQITLPLMWLGLAFHTLTPQLALEHAVWGAIAGYLSLWSVYWLFKLITGKEGMGYGDFKLLAALGAWMGWQKLPLIILLSSVVGAVIGIALMLIHRQGSKPIPFGPYLAGAGLIAMFWGDTLISNYLQFAGLSQ